MNRVELIGGLTRDAELRSVGQGTPLLEFTLALNGTRYSAEKREQVVTTTFVRCQAWGWLGEQLADLVLLKGETVHVLGELDQYEVEKDDGSKDSRTRIRVHTLTPTRRKSYSDPEPQKVPQDVPF